MKIKDYFTGKEIAKLNYYQTITQWCKQHDYMAHSQVNNVWYVINKNYGYKNN
jgi:hypothetical protein